MGMFRELAIGMVFVLISVLLAVNHNDQGIATGVSNPDNTPTNTQLLKSLRSVRDIVPKPRDKYIALGYNACVDIVLEAVSLLSAIGATTPAGTGEECESIGSKEELASCFLYFFRTAKAAERAVVNEDLYLEMSAALEDVRHKASLGGNAALMGEVLVDDFGFKVMLGGQVGPRLKQLIPKEMDFIGRKPEMHAIGNEPVLVRNDELHLIMEYGRETEWGDHPPPNRANRFIISSDATNAAIATLEPLNQLVIDSDEHPDLLVITGFNMLDSKSEEFRNERIQDTERSLDAIPVSVPIHFEMASMGDMRLLKRLAQGLLPRADSIGLNEQELATLYTVLGGKFSSSLQESKLVSTVPDPLTVSRAIEYVIASVQPLASTGSRALTRIHFHCFGYHIVAQTDQAEARGFGHVVEGTIAGSVKATERACAKKKFSDDELELHLKEVKFASGKVVKLTADKPYITWKNKLLTFTLAPVLACAKPVQTVGLGDSISASALAYQV